MIEHLEIIEESDSPTDNDIIANCRRELTRLFVLGSGTIFGLGQAMSAFGAS